MITSIMQPTFLPSAIYFSLILQSDNFVFLDNVQFSKQSWQQRNLILTNSGPKWITLPIEKKGNTLINEVKINVSNKLIKKNLKTIKESYSKEKYFKNYFPKLENIFTENDDRLFSKNIKIIKWICKCLDIKSNFYLSSELTNNLDRVERLIEICRYLNTTTYLSPTGSKTYLNNNEELFKQKNIIVHYNNFNNDNFTEKGKVLSILHFLFLKGPNTLDMIKKSILNNK